MLATVETCACVLLIFLTFTVCGLILAARSEGAPVKDETKNRIVSALVLLGFLALLAASVWFAWVQVGENARQREDDAARRHFSTSRYVTPPTAFHEPDDEWTDEKWAEFLAIYATATPEEREQMEAWLWQWWPRHYWRISRSKRVVVGGEG